MNKKLKKVFNSLFDPLRFITSNLSVEQSITFLVETNLVSNSAYSTELALPLRFDIVNSTIQYQKAQQY